MTHAALQDLLTRALPFLREAAEPFEDDGGNEPLELARAIECALESPAALSAMEAVAWQVRYRMVAAPGGWGQWHEWSLPDRPETINGWDAEYRPLYTAPPPQQAVKLSDLPMVDESKNGDFPSAESFATHPTPSPGPQGGGDRAAYGSVYGYCPTCGAKGAMRERRPNGDDICANNHKYPSRDALATPPANQPGEVITDEMVARGAAALADEFHDYYYWKEMDAYEREPWLTQSRMVLTAALSTTPASGGEHGR